MSAHGEVLVDAVHTTPLEPARVVAVGHVLSRVASLEFHLHLRLARCGDALTLETSSHLRRLMLV